MSAWSRCLPLYAVLFPNSEALVVDAFQLDWSRWGYISVPLSLMLSFASCSDTFGVLQGKGDPSDTLVAGSGLISISACLMLEPGHFSMAPPLSEGKTSDVLRWLDLFCSWCLVFFYMNVSPLW